MITAGIVIETQPGAAPRVAARLLKAQGLEIVGSDGHDRLAATWTLETGEALEAGAKALIAGDHDVLGVYPTFVGTDEDP